MALIGTFTKSEDGSYQGAIKTVTLLVKASFRPTAKDGDKAPDYRVYADAVEFGAAWKKTARDGRPYLSCKLDDPLFPAPVYASLVPSEDERSYGLIWTR